MPKEIPIHIPETEVEVIAERRKSRRRQRFDQIPSGVEGVQLVVEPGANPEFTRRDVIGFQAGFDRIERGKKAKVQSDLAREKHILAAKVSDYRGVVSERGNYRGTVSPNEKNIYDADLLEQSSGGFHQELVREEGHVEIDLPFGSDELGGDELRAFVKGVSRVLIEMGRDPDEVATMIKISLRQRLDEERLDQLIQKGQIELLSGTRSTEISWTVKTDDIEKATKPKRQRKLKSKDES